MLVSGLTKTGIEIDEDSTSGGTITLQGDRVYVKNGDDVAALFESGKIKADYLDADEIVTKALTGKTITAEELHVTGTTGSVDIDGKTGALSATSATIQGDFVSKNASTWIEYEMNAKKGYFEMRGPTGVDDMDRTKPDTGATKVTLARIFQNPDPDSLASVASLELMKGNTRKIYIDPIDGFCIQNVYNGGSEMDVSRTLTISAYGITYYDDNKNRYSKNWEDLLS